MNYKTIKQARFFYRKRIVFGILALAYLVSGCSKELFEEEVANNDYKLKKLTVNELKKDKNFNAAFYSSTGKNFSRELQKNVNHARYEESYIIADSMVNIVTNKNIVSYNIKIMYPTKPVTDTIYNLVIKDKVATSSEYFITKNLKINSILTPIEITNSNNESKSSILDCLIFHESPRDFPEVSIEIDWDCIDSGGGGDSSDNTSSEGGSSTPSGSTGTSGSSNAPGGGGNVLVYPNGGSTNTPASQNLCVTIKKLKKDFVFKTKLASLFQSAKIDNFEKYSVLSADPTPNVQEGQEDAYDYADAQGAPNAAGATYIAYTNSLGVIHSHYAGLNSIFSPDDLQDLYNKMLVPEIVDDFFIGVVTAEGTAYILQVTDRQAFINFGNKYLANDTKTRDFLEKIYKGKYNLNSDDKVENEKNFLNMMADLGMGTSLAGTNFSSTAQPTPNLFSNLQVKTLNEMTQNVQNTNCN